MEESTFELMKPRQPTEEQREATRLRVQKHREKKRKESSPSLALANAWQTNMDGLPDTERAVLLDRAAECKSLLDRMFADDFEAYRDVKNFVAESGGTVRHWVPVMSAPDVDLDKECASDQNFIKFGLRTRIWLMFYREYLRRLLVQGGLSGYGYKMDDSPNIGDAETLCEIKNEYDPMVAHLKEQRPPLSAPVVGVRQRTKNEEAAHLAFVEERTISQAAFDKSYRQHLLEQLNDARGEIENDDRIG